jgi:hypothetical protein
MPSGLFVTVAGEGEQFLGVRVRWCHGPRHPSIPRNGFRAMPPIAYFCLAVSTAAPLSDRYLGTSRRRPALGRSLPVKTKPKESEDQSSNGVHVDPIQKDAGGEEETRGLSRMWVHGREAHNFSRSEKKQTIAGLYRT